MIENAVWWLRGWSPRRFFASLSGWDAGKGNGVSLTSKILRSRWTAAWRWLSFPRFKRLTFGSVVFTASDSSAIESDSYKFVMVNFVNVEGLFWFCGFGIECPQKSAAKTSLKAPGFPGWVESIWIVLLHGLKTIYFICYSYCKWLAKCLGTSLVSVWYFIVPVGRVIRGMVGWLLCFCRSNREGEFGSPKSKYQTEYLSGRPGFHGIFTRRVVTESKKITDQLRMFLNFFAEVIFEVFRVWERIGKISSFEFNFSAIFVEIDECFVFLVFEF